MEWIVEAESIGDLLNGRYTVATNPVIRCKDCKWSDWYTAANGERYCYCLETGAAGRTEDDYCSYAEREEGEQNAD